MSDNAVILNTISTKFNAIKEIYCEKTNELKGDIREGKETTLKESQATQDTVIALAAAAGNRSDFPALWTLDYKSATRRIHSCC